MDAGSAPRGWAGGHDLENAIVISDDDDNGSGLDDDEMEGGAGADGCVRRSKRSRGSARLQEPQRGFGRTRAGTMRLAHSAAVPTPPTTTPAIPQPDGIGLSRVKSRFSFHRLFLVLQALPSATSQQHLQSSR